MISLTEFATLARQARDAQRKYFRERTQAALAESKDLEKKLDAAIGSVLDPKLPTLFGD